MKSDDALLLDMLLAAKDAEFFCKGMSLDMFVEDRRTNFAVMHCIQTLGEAAARVSQDTRQALPQIPWTQIVGLRHKLVHDYGHIDLSILWEIVQNNVPDLIATLTFIVPDEEEFGAQ
jgi:uncharacterized protein with HEPN domain